MNSWDQINDIVNDPNYFHGGNTNVINIYGLYNVTINRFIIVSTVLHTLKKVRDLMQEKVPTTIYSFNNDIDNSVCLAWTVKSVTNGIHIHQPSYYESIELLCVEPPVNLDECVALQKMFLSSYSSLT